jgi:hypothetical protein
MARGISDAVMASAALHRGKLTANHSDCTHNVHNTLPRNVYHGLCPRFVAITDDIGHRTRPLEWFPYLRKPTPGPSGAFSHLIHTGVRRG